MGLNGEYFFDSYALIELIKGNQKYLRFGDYPINITLFNLVEVTYAIFKEYGEEKSREIYEKFEECVYPIKRDVIFEAIRLRYKYKKRDLSYADCIGYVFAKRSGMRFLTGDKEFEDFDNVEFVKR